VSAKTRWTAACSAIAAAGLLAVVAPDASLPSAPSGQPQFDLAAAAPSAAGTATATAIHFAAKVATPPSSVRGPEVSLPGELPPGLPEVNVPPPTLYPTSTTAARPTTVAPRTEPERRGVGALNRISYDWETELPGWTIVFRPGRSSFYGLTLVDEQRIEIYVRTSQSDALLAHVIAHEMGHAVDVTQNSGEDRRRWQEARGISSAPWWPGSGAADFSTGAGDFAESFASWQVGTENFRSTLAGTPTERQLALMAELAAR
jgi:hypothetical protein